MKMKNLKKVHTSSCENLQCLSYESYIKKKRKSQDKIKIKSQRLFEKWKKEKKKENP